MDDPAQWTDSAQRAVVEAAIAYAARESLRYDAEERGAFIALTLLKKDTSAATLRASIPTAAQLEDEVAALERLLRDAVNSAARRPTEPPLECIAAFLISECEGLEVRAYTGVRIAVAPRVHNFILAMDRLHSTALSTRTADKNITLTRAVLRTHRLLMRVHTGRPRRRHGGGDGSRGGGYRCIERGRSLRRRDS